MWVFFSVRILQLKKFTTKIYGKIHIIGIILFIFNRHRYGSFGGSVQEAVTRTKSQKEKDILLFKAFLKL